MGWQGSSHLPRLKRTPASCFQSQSTRSGGPQDFLLLWRQVTALRIQLAELRETTER